MVVTPFVAALLIGSFWTGVGTTAVLSHSDLFDRSSVSTNLSVDADVGPSDDHIAACEARYRSYDAATDSYMGFDGSWHVCLL